MTALYWQQYRCRPNSKRPRKKTNMAHKITYGQLKGLLNDGMNALGLAREEAVRRGLVPQDFGRDGYKAAARLAAAGLTFEALAEAGLGLQSENHGVLTTGIMSSKTVRLTGTEEQIKAQQAALRDSYRAQHGGRSITPVCTGKNCPSGIVPLTIPGDARANNIYQWHLDLIAAVTSGSDNDIAVIPAIGGAAGTGTMLPGVTPTARVKAAAQPPAFLSFHGLLQSVKTGLAGMVAALTTADDQSQVIVPLGELKDYVEMFPPSLAGVTSAAFDDKVIRTGVEVNLIQGTAAFNVAVAALKRFGVAVDPTTVFTVVGPRMKDGAQKGWEYQPKGIEPLRNPLFAMIVEGQPSQLKRVVKAPPVVHTWKATAGELAMFGPDQVVILDVTGEQASVYYLDDEVAERQGHELGEEGAFNCPTSALTKPV